MALLDVRDVTMQFGGLVAVNKVSLELLPGALYGLIGPNGAGKTTLFNVITGVYTPTRGDVIFDGRRVTGRPPYLISARGIARTFQNIRLFTALTVLDNVKVAFDRKQRAGILSAVLRGPTHVSEETRIDAEARVLLRIFNLDPLAAEPAGSLPYGLQRRLEIARAMATRPKLLCLDEPAAGMNPNEAGQLMELIHWIRDQFQMTILLVEHNMKVVMGVCERVHVLDYGSTIALGTPSEIQADPRVIEAYLGGRVSAAAGVAPGAPILCVRDLRVSYGAIVALTGISLDLGRGEIVTLIGANGAGKSTALRTIMGLVPPVSGSVEYDGLPLARRATFEIVRAGMTLVPEGRAIFANLSVRENLTMGAYTRVDREVNADYDRVFEIFPRLKERVKQSAGTLSGGEQQMLAIGRALMSRPKVLLLDEPSLGLAPLLVHTIFESIEEVNRRGTSVLLVEQNANAALKHSHRAYVLETGAIALTGPSREIAENPKVKQAYLGE